MVVDVVGAVFFIILLYVIRDYYLKDERCRDRSSKSNSMEGTSKKRSKVPDTNRSTSGRNWEMYKDIIGNGIKSENEAHSISKKPLHAKPKRKSHTALLNMANMSQMSTVSEEVLEENKKGLTKHVAMDCEMVGIGDGTASMIARVSIVNRHGHCVYDKYVKARETVTDYRTKVSGIRPYHLTSGEEFEIVQKEVAEILKHRVLIGHAVKHDLDVLYLSHPRKSIRDTSRFKPFRQLSRGNTPSLKKLAHELLGRDIQIGEHSSVEDARAAMQLYVLYKNKWESEVYSKSGHKV